MGERSGAWDWTLPATAHTPARARRLVSGSLPELPGDTRALLLLLTSEVVTNAVLHGAGPLGLHLSSDAHGVQVAVDDSGPAQPVLRDPDLDLIGGRGLRLVEELSISWGVDRRTSGKTVWFRLNS